MIITIKCPYCGYSKRVLKEKIPISIKWIRCSSCNQRFEFKTDESPIDEGPEFSTEAGLKRIPSYWERRGDLGLWKGIYLTVKEVIIAPNKFFQGLTTSHGLREPLAFGILLTAIGVMFSVFFQILFFSGMGGLLHLGTLGGFGAGIIFLIFIILIPLFIVVYLFFSAGLIHLGLLIFRGAGNGFEGTFRVIAFSQAVQILGLIPFLGGAISGVYTLAVQLIGLKEIHETSYLKVILGYFVPIVVIVLFIIAMLIRFMSGIM